MPTETEGTLTQVVMVEVEAEAEAEVQINPDIILSLMDTALKRKGAAHTSLPMTTRYHPVALEKSAPKWSSKALVSTWEIITRT